MQVTADIELYDSDVPKIKAVAAKLREAVGERRNKEAFVREVMGRFHEAGYVVGVKITTQVANGGTVFYPEITIEQRVEPEAEYDYARQAAEVQSAELARRAGVGMPGAGKLWTPGGER